MAHADYHCCAICDRKMEYTELEARTKEDICLDCLRALHREGVPVYTGFELELWIKACPGKAVELLPRIGYAPCFYSNPLDEAFKAAMPAA